MPSSHGELTLQFEMRTLRQQSTSIASRLVSIFRLSMVRLSTPVARMAKCPPCKMDISRRVTLRQFFRLMDCCLCQGPARHLCHRGLVLSPKSALDPRWKYFPGLHPRSGCCASGCDQNPETCPIG